MMLFINTDHIRCHSHALVCVRQQRITKIVCNGKVRGGRRQRLLSQKEDILLNGSDHIVLSPHTSKFIMSCKNRETSIIIPYFSFGYNRKMNFNEKYRKRPLLFGIAFE